MPIQITGHLNYLSSAAVQLLSPDGTFLLAVDRPPMGLFSPAEFRDAAEFLRDILGKGQGSESTILGIVSSPLPGRDVLGIIRVLA